MARFKAVLLKKNTRKDGSNFVLIRVSIKSDSDYIRTAHTLSARHIGPKREILDPRTLRDVTNTIMNYEDEVKRLGDKIENFTVKTLIDHLKSMESGDIDFVKFGRDLIEQMIKDGKRKSSQGFRTAINALIDYADSEVIPISTITSQFLFGFHKFLKQEVPIKRMNKGVLVTTISKPLADAGIRNYMRDIRNLFNRACMKYNDEDTGYIVIKHNPFKKYKVKDAPRVKKDRDLGVDTIKSIRDADVTGFRAELGRDVFMMTFYLAGMNTVDFYNAVLPIKNGRLEYNRSKTKNRRLDQAFISVKIEPEVEELIGKYKDPTGERLFKFHEMYASADGFNAAVNKGLKVIDKDIDGYSARHSWSTIARNKCGISKDDIDEALNHVGDHALTDGYIRKDWSVLDNANRKVLNRLLPKEDRIKTFKKKKSRKTNIEKIEVEENMTDFLNLI